MSQATSINVASDLEGTSRKRRRTLDERSPESTTVIATSSTSKPASRDTKYYMDDGDCIIQIQGTLFKVHKTVLLRDSSAFEGMFSIPQKKDSRVDGASDQQPIILSGDTPEQFRSLLFILYALPHQIEALLLEKVTRFSEFLTIAEIANKYQFSELSSWAVKTVKSVFGQTTVSPVYHERILHLAMVSNELRLYDIIMSSLTERLLDGTLAPTETLIMADRLHIRHLQGVAYYAQLLALEKNNSDATLFPPGCPLSKDQRVRLLAGYMLFVKQWEHLRKNPVDDRSPACPTQSHMAVCRPRWNSQWRSYANSQQVTQHSPADILGKMQAMHRLLQANFPPQSVSAQINNGLNHAQLSQQVISMQNNHQQNPQQPQNTHAVNHHPPNFPVPNNHLQGIPLQMMSMSTMVSPHTCIQRALFATKKLLEGIRESLPDIFSDAALGLT